MSDTKLRKELKALIGERSPVWKFNPKPIRDRNLMKGPKANIVVAAAEVAEEENGGEFTSIQVSETLAKEEYVMTPKEVEKWLKRLAIDPRNKTSWGIFVRAKGA